MQAKLSYQGNPFLKLNYLNYSPHFKPSPSTVASFLYKVIFLALTPSLLDLLILYVVSFPDSLVGKESDCNSGDPGSIHELGRSPGEGIGYPLQYSWASLVAQLIKNPPAMWET